MTHHSSVDTPTTATNQNSSLRQKIRLSADTLRLSYLTTFGLVLLLAILSQVVIQFSLAQENVSRQVSTLFSQQIVYSQRMQNNTILLIAPIDHQNSDAQLASDTAAIQENAAHYRKDYASTYPEIAVQLPHDASATYASVIDAATHLILLEKRQYPTNRARVQAESHYITQMFYSERKQLVNLEQVQTIVDSDTDSYIRVIQRIELLFFVCTLAVLLFE